DSSFFFFTTPPPPRSTLFPYTTLFRSQALGGEVWVESEVGSGARFFVRLPLAAPHQLAPLPVPAAAPLPQEAKVLLVHGEWQARSEEHTSELQSRFDLVCRLLLEKKKK